MPESVVVPLLDQMALPNGDSGGPLCEATKGPEVPESVSPPAVDSPRSSRDSAWLQVEVCRDFRRDTCPRGEHCRFAHPEAKIIGKDGKVTCCYDFLKGRCKRDFCKYYHPPLHIKEKLVNAGRQFGAMMMRYSPAIQPMPHNMMSDGQVSNGAFYPGGSYMDRISVCQDFVIGQCVALICPLAHPGPFVYQNADQTVTICRNFSSGFCTRGERCKFYHPHLHQYPTYFSSSSQGFIGQPYFVPVMPSPPPPVVPVGLQFPFSPPLTPTHVPISLASPAVSTFNSFIPPVPVVPMLPPTSTTSMPIFPPQPVVTPVSIIETTPTTTPDFVTVQGAACEQKN